MQREGDSEKVPLAVYVLAAGVFSMVTSEFAVAGLMPQLAAGLGVDISMIGYLVTVYAGAMAIGGPLLTIALLRFRPKVALLALMAIFLGGNIIAALAANYSTMLVARVICGASSQAFLGITLSVCSRLVAERIRGRAAGVAMNGLMLGTLLGLPMATFIGGRLGWHSAFWAIAAVTITTAILTVALVPNLPVEHPGEQEGVDSGEATSGGEMFRSLLRPQLLFAYLTSMLIIGATFAAFSFFTPILTEVSGFSEGVVPLLLIAYGCATFIGNNVVARLADTHTLTTPLVGAVLNAFFLFGFATFTEMPSLAVIFMLGIGLVGISMNPAFVVRVQRAGGTHPLVNSLHVSFITAGIMLGSAAGATLIPHLGLRAPVFLGVGLAVLAVFAILPALANNYLRSGVQRRDEMPPVSEPQPTPPGPGRARSAR